MALRRQQIVDEALALLNENGLDELSLRKLADRLGVRAPTLYWHIPNKRALVEAVAETMLKREFPELLPPGPEESSQAWMIGMAERVRRAMLACTDGARVLSASHLSPTMTAISELQMRCLTERGVPLREARIIVLTVEHFTMGHVLKEQAPRPDAEVLADFDMERFAERHPTVVSAISEYFQDGHDVDALFRDCLELILAPSLDRPRSAT